MNLFGNRPLVFRRSDREDSLLKNLQRASRLMWILLLGAGAFVAWDVLLTEDAAVAPMPAAATIPIAAPGGEFKLEELDKPVAAYVAAFTERNPFTGGGEQAAPAQAAQQQPATKSARQRLQEIAKDLIIVGIDHGKFPQAIIEDSAQHRTHFLKVGDMINGLVIVDISARGVILSYEGEELLMQ